MPVTANRGEPDPFGLRRRTRTRGGTTRRCATSYLAKHDVVYNRSNSNPLHGRTLGNGRTGAMAWSEKGHLGEVQPAQRLIQSPTRVTS
ncbi:hypothetical protein [Micromonospora sp. WMMD736]|uniref:hypothetical protein n=1 Tax=Micromonospora sp. WMMD736 TaxID=3404112 RepID=UPI003B93E56C